MATKCILFDADGVVINSEMFSVQYQKEHGVSGDKMLPFFKEEFQNCIIGKADLIESVKPWLPKWKWAGTADEFLQYWFKAEHNVDEKLITVVQQLREKGIKCYLATNQEKYRTKYMKEEMKFKELFNHVFSSADIGYKKPESEFYKFILAKIENEYKIYPHEIMFFDDSQENAAEAKRLNINAHFYKNFEDFENLVKPILNNKALIGYKVLEKQGDS